MDYFNFYLHEHKTVDVYFAEYFDDRQLDSPTKLTSEEFSAIEPVFAPLAIDLQELYQKTNSKAIPDSFEHYFGGVGFVISEAVVEIILQFETAHYHLYPLDIVNSGGKKFFYLQFVSFNLREQINYEQSKFYVPSFNGSKIEWITIKGQQDLLKPRIQTYVSNRLLRGNPLIFKNKLPDLFFEEDFCSIWPKCSRRLKIALEEKFDCFGFTEINWRDNQGYSC